MTVDQDKAVSWLTKAAIWCLPFTMALVGLVYMFGDDWRTANAAYEVPKVVLPIQAWGVLFLAVALFEWFVHWRRSLYWMIMAKCIGAALCLVWALMLGGSLLLHLDEAPIVFPLLFFSMAFYHLGVVTYLVRSG